MKKAKQSSFGEGKKKREEGREKRREEGRQKEGGKTDSACFLTDELAFREPCQFPGRTKKTVKLKCTVM